VFVKVCAAEVKRMSEPVETESVLFLATAVVAKAVGGWMGASINAPIAAATRDADFLLNLISLSFHQFD
jgi:hypothetical protein